MVLLIAVSSFFILSYTGYVSHTGSIPAILVGHFFQTGIVTTEFTSITIVNKGSTAQMVTVKFWNNEGVLKATTSRSVEPNNRWALATGSSGDLVGTRATSGHFIIEAPDVSKLFAQAFVYYPRDWNINLPVTITLWQPSGASAPTTTSSTDTSLPDTTLTSTPRSSSISTSAAFSFTSTVTGSTFECKLDTGSFESCTSPKRYTGLSRSSHTFSVRSRDAAGNLDPTPATFTWSII